MPILTAAGRILSFAMMLAPSGVLPFIFVEAKIQSSASHRPGKLRTALRTVETSSYTYFGVLRRSPSLSKLFSVLVSWPLTR